MGVLAGRYKTNQQSPKNSKAILRGGFYADRVNKKGIEAGLKLNKIAENLGLTSAQLAVLWVKHQKGVTAPLIGPRTIKHLKEFIKIFDKSIDESVCELCDQIVPPGSAVADFHNTAPWMKMKI
jgi:aryl-alcohol dehydrogenase-like predicted oxidoreductase